MSLVAHPQAKDCEEKPLVMDNADLQQGEHAAMGDPTEEPKAPEAEAPSEGEATNVGCGEENRADLKIGDTKRSLSAANPEHCDIDPSAGDVPSVEAENKMAVFPPVEAEGKMVDAAKDGKARDDGEIEAPEGKAVHEIVEKEQVGDAPKTDSGDVQDYDADVQKMEKKNEHEIEAEVTEESERKKREVSRLEEREREVAELVQHAEDLEKKAIHLEQQASILDQAADEMEREAIARQQAREGRDDSDEDLEPDSASGSPEEKRFDWDGMIADLETKLAAARDRVEESKEARNVARSKLKRWKAADLASEAGLSEESGDSTAQASEDEDDDDISQKTTSDTAALEETVGGLKDSGEKASGTSEDPAPTESLLRATFSEAKAKVSQAKKALTKVEHKLRKAKKEHREPLEPQAVKRQKLDKKAKSIALKQSSSKTQLHAETEDNTAASKSLDERPKEKVNKADGAEGKLIGEKQRGADKMYVRPVEGGDVKVEQSVAKVDKEREGEVDPAKRGRADGELQEHYAQEAEIKVAGKLATGEEEAEEKPEGCETTEPEEPVTSTDQDVVGAPATPPEPQTRAPEGEPIAARGPPTTSTAEMDVTDSRLAPNVALLADESKGVAVEAEGDKAAGRGGRVGVEEKEGAALVPATHADSSSSDESAATALPGAAAAVDEDEDEEADGHTEGPMLRLGAGPGLPLGRFPAARVVAEMAPRLGDLPAAFERVFGARDEDSSSGGSQEADGLEDRRPPAPSTSGGLAARERSGGGGRARPQFAPPPPESPASAATALTGLFAAPAKEREEEDEEEEEEPEAREQGPRRLARRWSLEGPHASPLPAPARLYSSASSNAASLPALTGPALGREADAEEEEEEEEGEGGSLGTASTLSADAKAPLAAPAAAPAPARPAAPPRSRWERWVRRVLRGLVPREPHASAVPAPAPAPATAPPPPPQRAAAAQRSAPALALGLGAARRYPAGPPASAPATASAASVVPLGAAAGVAMAAGAGLALGAGAGAGAGPEPGSRNACSLGRMAVFRARPPAALAERKKAKRDKEQQQQQQQMKESGRAPAESLGALAAMKKKSASLLRRTLGLKKEAKGEQGRSKDEPGPSTSSACPAAATSTNRLHVGFLEDDNMEDIQLDVPQNEIENSSSHAQMSRKPEKKTEDRDVNLNKTEADVHKEESD